MSFIFVAKVQRKGPAINVTHHKGLIGSLIGGRFMYYEFLYQPSQVPENAYIPLVYTRTSSEIYISDFPLQAQPNPSQKVPNSKTSSNLSSCYH